MIRKMTALSNQLVQRTVKKIIKKLTLKIIVKNLVIKNPLLINAENNIN